MLSLSEKSVISLPHRAASWTRVCHRTDPRLVGQSPVSKCLSTALPSSAGIFFPLPPSSGALLFCFGNPFSTKSNTRLIELWCSFGCTSSVQDIQNVLIDYALSENLSENAQASLRTIRWIMAILIQASL